MTDAEINSVLFRGVIAELNNIYAENGELLNRSNMRREFEFTVAYQKRPMERFAHQYEREKFLHNRDKFICIQLNGRLYILVRCQSREHITIYKKPMELAFTNKSDRAISILEKLMHKFYDSVDTQTISDVHEVDLSNGMSPSGVRVTYEV